MISIPVSEPHLDGNEEKYVLDCIKSGWISSNGKYVELFEEKFAEYCNSKYAISVTNGTVALHLALKSIGIKEGDEIIIPNFTMAATAFAIRYLGAIPVFVDVKSDTWNIDTKQIQRKISKKTKAILYVSIFGSPCDMEQLWILSKEHSIKLIEDAAESHGAEYKNEKVGSLADVTTFSFYSNKNLTTGEGGMVVTNDKKISNNCRYFKNMCFKLNGPRDYIHNDLGYNYRMSNIHAAIGLAQVEKANYYRELRIKIGERYMKNLSGIDGVILQKHLNNTLPVYWVNGLIIEEKDFGKDRKEVIKILKNNGVDTRLFFQGMNKQPFLNSLNQEKSSYPVTDYLSKKGFYLPSHSKLSFENIDKICEIIINCKKT